MPVRRVEDASNDQTVTVQSHNHGTKLIHRLTDWLIDWLIDWLKSNFGPYRKYAPPLAAPSWKKIDKQNFLSDEKSHESAMEKISRPGQEFFWKNDHSRSDKHIIPFPARINVLDYSLKYVCGRSVSLQILLLPSTRHRCVEFRGTSANNVSRMKGNLFSGRCRRPTARLE